MRRVIETIKQKPSILPLAVIMVVAYVIMNDVLSLVPYLNILTKGLAAKLVVLWVLMICLIRPSTNVLLIMSGIILLLDSLSIMLGLELENQGFGLMIYASLLYLAYKLFKERIDSD